MKRIQTSATVFLVALFSLIALLFVNRLIWPDKSAQTPNVKTVFVREGLTAVEISKILKDEGIFIRGEILPSELDGYLFPDTYEFFVPSSLDFVVKKFSGNFSSKVAPVLSPETLQSRDTKEVLTVASMIEDEAANALDRRMVSGIIWKRLKAGQRLQIDATICYVKPHPCFPITRADLTIDSHYNTYLYKGLPPGPISNPGLDSIRAALEPKESSYWFYITNPKTKEAVFARTLDEHNANVAKYLH